METNQDCHQTQEQELRVCESVDKLFGFESGANSACCLLSHMLRDHNLFLLGQEFRGRRGVRNPKEGREAQHNSDATQHDEHHSPTLESQACHMLECERQKSSNNLAYAKPAIPESKTWALLRLGIPLAAHQSQSRHDRCFTDSKKYTRN